MQKTRWGFSLALLLILLVANLPLSHASNAPTIETLGLPGYSRTFADPTDIAVLPDKSLLILDRDKYTIFRLVGNELTQFADFKRNFPSYFTGDEPCAMDSNRSGDVFVVNCSQTTIYRFSPNGNLIKSISIQKLGVTDRGFDWGGGLVVDSNSNVFLTDEKNSLILKINTTMETTEVYAGKSGIQGQDNGFRLQATFNLPRGLAIDQQDNLFIGDYSTGRIRKIGSNGQVSTLDLEVCLPTAIDIDSQGNLIVVSEYFCGSRITKISLGGSSSVILDDSAESVGNVPWALIGKPILGADSNIGIKILAGGGQKTDAYVVTDGKNGSVKFFDTNGKLLRIVGGTDVFGVNKYPKQTPVFNSPGAIYPLSDGTFLVSDNARLRQVSNTGLVLRSMNLLWGCGASSVLWPDGTLFCSTGSSIQVRNPDGTTLRIGSDIKGLVDGDNSQARFDCVSKLSFDGQRVLAVDGCNHAVRTIEKVGESKTFRVGTLVSGIALQRQDFTVTKRAATFSWPSEVATSPDGNIFIAEGGMDRLRKLDPRGEGSVSIVGGNFKSWPRGIVIDGRGRVLVITERGYLYEVQNNALVKIGGDGPGINEGLLSDSLFYSPQNMAIDIKGDLLISDAGNHVIRKVSGLNLVPNLIYDIKPLSKLLSSFNVIQPNQQSTSDGSGNANENASSTKLPDKPTFNKVNFSGNTLNISVNLGGASGSRPDKVYLVAPKLGIYSGNPSLGKISDNLASWGIKISPTIEGESIPLEIFSEKNGQKSSVLSGTYIAPKASSEVRVVSAPAQPVNFRSRISGSSVLVTVDLILKQNAIPTDVLLYSNSLGISKTNALRGDIMSNKALIEIPIKASMVGNKYQVSIVARNSKGESKPLSGAILIPKPSKQDLPSTISVPPQSQPKTTICSRSNQTRAFEGELCPPGWEKR